MIICPPPVSYFNVLGLKIHFYSVCIFFAVTIPFLLLIRLIDKKNISADKSVVYDIAPGLIISAVVGARLYYVLLNLKFFILKPLSIFFVWQGGIAIHGAIIGGIIYAFWYLKRHNIPFLKYADIFSFILPLGQSIGRWGNFFNSEAFGAPCGSDIFIKLFVDKQFRPEIYTEYDYFHPAFLYESIFDFLIFIFLLILYKKAVEKSDGLVFFSYIVLYSTIRIPLEFLRVDTVFYLFNIPFPVIISILCIVIGMTGIYLRFKQS